MPEGRQPRGVTPRLRSGAAAESTRLQWRRNGQEELPCVGGWGGGGEEIPSIRRQGWQREELPHVRGQGQRRGGATHARGQGWWPGGPNPHPRSCGCAGTGGPRGPIPR